ncbi:MAG: hypothetical protein ACK56I_30420, partial [bacterium]
GLGICLRVALRRGLRVRLRVRLRIGLRCVFRGRGLRVLRGGLARRTRIGRAARDDRTRALRLRALRIGALRVPGLRIARLRVGRRHRARRQRRVARRDHDGDVVGRPRGLGLEQQRHHDRGEQAQRDRADQPMARTLLLGEGRVGDAVLGAARALARRSRWPCCHGEMTSR